MAELSAALTLLLASIGLNETLYPPQANLTNNATFDYIIVGGGTAGCVLARRLAEDQNCSVLVLEAGGDPPISALLPGLFASLPGTSIDYNYQSTYDTYAAGQGNYTTLTSGKVLGGSSTLNHFVDLRCVKEDYDKWANITGKDWWKYENVLQYFKKSETLMDSQIMSMYPSYHGTHGPIGKTRQRHDNEVADYYRALSEAENFEVIDLNGPINVGYTQPLLTIAEGLRQTPAFVYLNPIMNYSNLHISRETVVTKIIFENQTAVAVEAVYNNVTYTFNANKEIILSAGVFNSPKILQLSGVGPEDYLTSMGIDVISNLPVGDNFIIAPAVCIVHKTKKYEFPIPSLASLAVSLNPTVLPFPLLVGSAALNKLDNVPNYQTYNLILPHDTTYVTAACSSVYGYNSDICASWQDQVVSREAMYTVVVGLETKSRGTIRLNSTNPLDDPVITTGFYNNTEDLDKMVKIVKDFVKIGDTPTFKKMDAAVVGVNFTECADKTYGTDEFWRCYISQRTVSDFFTMGTCPMGTVVDGELKLIGMKNLRVIDASVFPEPMHGATYAAVVALAEIGAELIKNSA